METQIIKLLKKTVTINSIYPQEKSLLKYLETIFNKYKITKQYIEHNRYNLLIEKGVGSKSILLYAHVDTVGTTTNWQTNPFKLKIIKNNAYGLGAWDMKGGMAVNIITFLNYHPKNFKLKLALCVDEENISRGGHKLIQSSFIKDVACVLSTEPAFKYSLQGLVIGRIGRVVFDVSIKGTAKHFAFYKKENDTNLFAADFIKHIALFNKEETTDKKQFIFARKINSTTVGMSIPSQTNLELDCAVLPPLTSKKILTLLKNLGKKLKKNYQNIKIEINLLQRPTPFLEPYEINKNNAYLNLLKKSVKKITKKNAVPYFRSSVADENIFGAHGIATFGIGPIGANAHAPNEWVSLPSLITLQKIISHFLSKAEML